MIHAAVALAMILQGVSWVGWVARWPGGWRVAYPRAMSMEFLAGAQVAEYGRFEGVPSRAALERFFFLDDADKNLIGDRWGDHNRLGFMLQATTVRYIGRFLEDPLDVPWPVVEYLAGQLGIADASCVKRYTDRAMTAYEHSWRRCCVDRNG